MEYGESIITFENDVNLWRQGKIPLDWDDEKMQKWSNEEQGPVFYLMFGITYECQLNCRHCCTGTYIKEKGRDLTTEEIKNVLDQAAKPLIVNFFGGEPGLRSDIMELIEYAKKKSIFVFMDTNGILITKKYAQKLKDSGLDILYVSVDSPVPEKHDEFRVMKGSFDKAIQAVKNALEVGLKCLVSTYITTENLDNGEYEQVIQLSKDLGATGVRYLLPTPAGRWLRNPEVKLTPQEEDRVWEISEFPFVNRDFYFQNQNSSQCRGMSDKAYMYISPYGDVQPCCFMPLSFGNIRDEPLRKILNRMWSHQLFEHESVYTECPMLNNAFRKEYIDIIPPDAKLPHKM